LQDFQAIYDLLSGLSKSLSMVSISSTFRSGSNAPPKLLARDGLPGVAAFEAAHGPVEKRLIGADGTPLEAFLGDNASPAG
jgi:hypothetical protein